MNEDRRNPYLILGVPYGTGREEATAAFATRSRRSRREADFPYSVDDLTWALHQIEERIENPTADVGTYRVPADPDVLKPPPGPGVLRLKPVPLPRRTEPLTEADREALRSLAVKETIAIALTQDADAVVRRYGLDKPGSKIQAEVVRRKRWFGGAA